MIKLGDEDPSAPLVGPKPAAGEELHDRVLYANALPDTDLVAMPTPAGVELSLHVRSKDAPGEATLDLDLPAGIEAKLVEGDADHPPKNGIAGSVQLTIDGKGVGAIQPPIGFDADGTRVEARLSLDGDKVKISYEHQSADLHYPLVIDPNVDRFRVDANGNPITTGSYVIGSGAEAGAWNYTFGGAPAGYYSNYPAQNGTTYDHNNVLAIQTFANAYYTNDSVGQWYFQAPRSANIWRADYIGLNFNWTGDAYPRAMCAREGIYSASAPGWETGPRQLVTGPGSYLEGSRTTPWIGGAAPEGSCSSQVNNSQNHFVRSDHGPPGRASNSATYGMFAYGTQTRLHGSNSNLYGADIFLDDSQPAYATSATTTVAGAGPGGWVKSAAVTSRVKARDATPGAADAAGGLGTWVTQFWVPSSTGPQPINRYNACNRDRVSRCPLINDLSLNYTTDDVNPDVAEAQPMPEGPNTILANPYDVLLKGTSGSAGTVKVDRTGPEIIPSGALYESRNQEDDHRSEGLYDAEAAIHVAASDGSDTTEATKRSGVKSIQLFIDRNSNGSFAPDEEATKVDNISSCATGQCPYTSPPLEYTLTNDELADGDYRVKVLAIDLVDNASEQEWTVTVDRSGDVHHATASTTPGSGSEEIAEEWAQHSTFNARRVTGGDVIETRDNEGCAGGECAVVRSVGPSSESDTPGVPAYKIEQGANTSDGRQISDLLEAANVTLPTPSSSGSTQSLLNPWQRRPPGSGGTYGCYDLPGDTAPETDDATVRRVCIDEQTKLPLRETILDGGIAQDDVVYYSYSQRKTAGEVASDLFRVAPPAGAEVTTIDRANPPAAPTAPEPEDDDLSYALDFRDAFGLDTTLSVVNDLLAAPGRDPEAETYSTPLTASELSTVTARLGLSEALRILQDYGEGPAASDYAGAYMKDGLAYIAFTSSTAAHTDVLQGLFTHLSSLRVVAATYTIDQLDAKAAEIDGDTAWQAANDIDVTSVGVDVEANRVNVGVLSPSTASEAALIAKYGAGVVQTQGRVAESLATRKQTTDIPPIYGGFELHKGLEGGSCSAGFAAYRNINGKRHNYIMTAGHCGTGLPGRTWFHQGSQSVGTSAFAQWKKDQHPGNVDVAYIRVPSRKYLRAKVWGNRKGDLRPIRAFDPYPRNKDDSEAPQTHVGEPVCISGYRHRRLRCGKVTEASTLR